MPRKLGQWVLSGQTAFLNVFKILWNAGLTPGQSKPNLQVSLPSCSQRQNRARWEAGDHPAGCPGTEHCEAQRGCLSTCHHWTLGVPLWRTEAVLSGSLLWGQSGCVFSLLPLNLSLWLRDLMLPMLLGPSPRFYWVLWKTLQWNFEL